MLIISTRASITRKGCNVISHISNTQLSMFCRCQAAWAFRYCDGLIIPPKAKMMRGTCIHRALSHNYMPKIESHEDLPVDNVLDCYSTHYDDESHVVEWHEGEDKGKMKDAGVGVVRKYQEEIAPSTQPVDVEQSFSMGLSWKNGDDDKQMEFKGIIDLITDSGVLIDHKSTGQTPKSPRQSDVGQLTGYVLGREAMEGDSPTLTRLDYLVALKSPVIVRFDVPVTDGSKKFLLGQIPRIVRTMEAGNYYPNRSNMYCSETGCGYWQKCLQKYGG